MAHPDAPAPLVALGKPLALLAYLGLAPNRTASRERLADLLWGDHERADARHALRRALSFLRSRVGDWVLVADDHTCTASPELGVDVVDFVARVERGDYAAALELYRGDFLAGFASPGGREFEAWADIERAHLRSRAVRAADAWCRDALDRARFADARRAARRVGEIDRESELGWRLRLEVLVAAGDRLGAAAEAAHFQAWLAAEARDPEPA